MPDICIALVVSSFDVSMVFKEAQSLKILDISVTLRVSSGDRSIEAREEHPENNEPIMVRFGVLKLEKSNDLRLEQFLNIPLMMVASRPLKDVKSSIVNELHPENMYEKFCTLVVSNRFRFINASVLQSSNIKDIFVVEEVSKLLTSTAFKEEQPQNMSFIEMVFDVLK